MPIWAREVEQHGALECRLPFPWQDTDLKGAVLIQRHQSSLLTKVPADRQTICKIVNPDSQRCKLAAVMTQSAEQASDAHRCCRHIIAKLHEDVFETLVGMLLERQGYHRVSRLDGIRKIST